MPTLSKHALEEYLRCVLASRRLAVLWSHRQESSQEHKRYGYGTPVTTFGSGAGFSPPCFKREAGSVRAQHMADRAQAMRGTTVLWPPSQCGPRCRSAFDAKQTLFSRESPGILRAE